MRIIWETKLRQPDVTLHLVAFAEFLYITGFVLAINRILISYIFFYTQLNATSNCVFLQYETWQFSVTEFLRAIYEGVLKWHLKHHFIMVLNKFIQLQNFCRYTGVPIFCSIENITFFFPAVDPSAYSWWTNASFSCNLFTGFPSNPHRHKLAPCG